MFSPETVHPSLSGEAIDEYISTVMCPLSRGGGGGKRRYYHLSAT